MLDRVTPVILTLNEAANIGRTLDRLRWAKDVVVVDSLSTDDTRAIAARFPNVRWFERKFDSLGNQWLFAINETGIKTDWILRLGADYWLPQPFIDELAALAPPFAVAGYRTRFVYCIYGEPLRGSLYPPDVHLFDRTRSRIYQDGHAEAVEVHGEVGDMRSPIHHDDRKPLERFFLSQVRYLKEEADKLSHAPRRSLSLADRLRRHRFFAPFAVLAYCLFRHGLILDGRRGIFYSLQRTLAELMLSLYLIDRDLRKPPQ